MSTQLKTTFAAAAGLVLAASSASAAIIVQETFSGGATSLVGSVTGDGNSWTGSSSFQADGTLSGSNYRSAYLSLGGAIVDGEIYTIDISYVNNGNGNNNEPLRVGLAVGNLDNNGFDLGEGQRSGGPAFDIFADGESDIRAYPDSTSSDTSYDSRGASPTTSLQMVLNTQNASEYTLAFYNGATQLGSTQTLADTYAFDTLWIGHERASGSMNFDSITVSDTAAVPEPSSTALLGLGGLALILRRRR